MDPQLKQRVVGAAVLVALGVIFIPIFLEGGGDISELEVVEDNKPVTEFSSRVVPIDDETMEQVERQMEMSAQELEDTEQWQALVAEDGDSAASNTTSDAPSDDGETAAPRMGLNAWVVQLGSFSAEENARGLVARLNEKNYTAFIEPSGEAGKITFRVRVGPELTKEAADKVREQLSAEVDLEGIVMRYP